jgi:hypothetical protein
MLQSEKGMEALHASEILAFGILKWLNSERQMFAGA